MKILKKFQQIFVIQRIRYIEDKFGGFTKSYEDLGKIYGDMQEKVGSDNTTQKKNMNYKKYFLTVSKTTAANLAKEKDTNDIYILYKNKKFPVKNILINKDVGQIQL